MNIEEIIIQRYPNEKTSKIAEDLGLSYYKVCKIAYKNNIKKSDSFMKSIHSGKFEPGYKGGEKTQFKKGNIPYNKGLKMPKEIYDKVKYTMFQKGNKPHNTKKDDSISWREDTCGRVYAYKKIKDGVWILYHRFLWELNNGPIPKNHVVYFKDGDTRNLNLENLDIRSRVDNMITNSMASYPKELKEVIKLKNKLNKKINGKK